MSKLGEDRLFQQARDIMDERMRTISQSIVGEDCDVLVSKTSAVKRLMFSDLIDPQVLEAYAVRQAMGLMRLSLRDPEKEEIPAAACDPLNLITAGLEAAVALGIRFERLRKDAEESV